MEFLGEIFGRLIGESILGFALAVLYKMFIRPILIAFGFMSFLVKSLFVKDIKSFESTTYEDFEKAGGDLIIGSLVIALLLLIVFMIVYFGFYMFDN
jgi:hypothetical protein